MSRTKISKNARRAPGLLENEALTHHFAAETTAHQSVAHGALSGLALKSLKKEAGVGNWEDFHAATFGERLPIRTAQKYMLIAEGLRVKAKDRPKLDALLATPASQKTEEQRACLAKMVREITDGETMASLIEAYRITKRPPAAPTGGYSPDLQLLAAWLAEQSLPPGTPYQELTTPQQAAYRQWESARQAERTLSPEQTAFDFYSPLLRDLEGDQFGEKRWMHLPDAERSRLRDTLRAMLAELDATFPVQS